MCQIMKICLKDHVNLKNKIKILNSVRAGCYTEKPRWGPLDDNRIIFADIYHQKYIIQQFELIDKLNE